MENNTTEWFTPNIKPVNIGVYQTEHCSSFLTNSLFGYQYWNGEFWGMYNSNADSAYLEREHKSRYQHTFWRGLTSPAS